MINTQWMQLTLTCIAMKIFKNGNSLAVNEISIIIGPIIFFRLEELHLTDSEIKDDNEDPNFEEW